MAKVSQSWKVGCACAAIVGILLFLAIINWASTAAGGALGDFLSGLSVFERFDSFSKGVLDSGDVLFFLSLIGTFVFLTVRSLDWKRW